MIPISEIAAALSTIKTAKNLVKSFLPRDSNAAHKAELLDVVTTLQSQIISIQDLVLSLQDRYATLQSKYTELHQRERDLSQQIENMNKWDEESAKYTLAQISPGVFVYSQKEEAIYTAGPHYWLCAYCYENRKKSILQLHSHSMAGKTFKCPSCKNEIHIPAP